MTAYERRISDWSSDVCSSDLAEQVGAARCRAEGPVSPGRVIAAGVVACSHARADSRLGFDADDEGGEQRLAIGAAALGQGEDRRHDRRGREIGRASSRERVLQYL